MHELSRQVRFSVNPFFDQQIEGDNVYCSKPCGEGLSLFFTLWVQLAGPVDQDTGFVVNVVDIDKSVRKIIVPLFTDKMKHFMQCQRHMPISQIARLIADCIVPLDSAFSTSNVASVTLELNPLRKIKISQEKPEMIFFSEKFEFAASHKLWNDKLSEDENYKRFGKCANPTGHGHNYVLEVTIKAGIKEELSIGSFEKSVNINFIDLVDHKNLNVDVKQFGDAIPTVENIAQFAWQQLADIFGQSKLESVAIWETDRTCCVYKR